MNRKIVDSQYKKWLINRAKKIERNKRKRKNKNKSLSYYIHEANHDNSRIDNEINSPILAPVDFRVLENTEASINFFAKLRNESNMSTVNGVHFVEMSLKEVEKIDYSTISILSAISDDLRYKRVLLRGNFPENEESKQFLIDSGFLDKMFDENGKRFPKSNKSEMLFFDKGTHRFTKDDNIRISNAVKSIMKHLTGEDGYCQSIRTILLEICGNAIEWSKSEQNQWLLGIKYEEERVIVTVTDVGKGIINTLYRKYGQKFSDFVSLKSNSKILMGAFEKKYGSKSQKINRNKGLPSIRHNFIDGHIEELKVITNNVILHFDNENLSRTFDNGNSWFKGTFYRWVVTKDSILKKTKYERKDN